MCGSKQKASETTDNIRQNENIYLKRRRKCIILFIYFKYLLKKICTSMAQNMVCRLPFLLSVDMS